MDWSDSIDRLSEALQSMEVAERLMICCALLATATFLPETHELEQLNCEMAVVGFEICHCQILQFCY